MSARRTLRWLFIIIIVIGIVGLLSRYRLRRTTLQVEVEDRFAQTKQTVTVEGGPEVPLPSPTLATFPDVEIESVTLIKRFEGPEIEQLAQRFLGSQRLPPVVSTVDLYEVDFVIANTINQAPLKLQVYVPHSLDSSSPVFLFGSGTTGLADRCAPTREKPTIANWGDYQMHLVTQAAQDTIVVFPDYEGFNDLDKPQAYFSQESEAEIMAAALEVVGKLPTSVALDPDWRHIFLTGYSQGGHAAMSLAKHPALIAQGRQVAGIIGYAGASSVEALLSDRPQLAPYVVLSYRSLYGEQIEVDKILQPHWAQKLEEQAGDWCINEVFQRYPLSAQEIYTPEFARALVTNRLNEVTPHFARAVQENSEFQTDFSGIPVLLLQGLTDPIVTAPTQRKNRLDFCNQGATVWYKEYPNVNHFQTRSAGFLEGQRWMNALVAGQSAVSNCQDFF